jgi:MFS family permease
MTSLTQPRSEHDPIYRRNFPYFMLDNLLFTLAMSLIGTTTLIPDFIRHLTSSEVLIGFSSSLFDVGWALPQLFIARYIVRHERKKWWFVGPNIPVRFVILIFAILTVMLGKDRPDAILIAFLIAYSVAALGDGLVGVPWAVLAGTSLDNRWRARLFGWTTAISGVIMLGVSPLVGIALGSSGLAFPNNYALIFGASGLLFAISILPVIFVHELPGGKPEATTPSIRVFLPGLGKVLRQDTQFRAMIAARMLTSLFAMAGPFYIGFATVQLGLSSSVAVPVLLAMQTIGSVGGALLYSWLGARSNLLYIRLALGLATLIPLSALLASVVGPLPLYFGFLISGLTSWNLFMSYQNWVITYATPEQRPVYAGLFNTAAAFISLIAPVIGGTIAQQIGYEILFVVALAMVLGAWFVSMRYIHSNSSTVSSS